MKISISASQETVQYYLLIERPNTRALRKNQAARGAPQNYVKAFYQEIVEWQRLEGNFNQGLFNGVIFRMLRLGGAFLPRLPR